MDLYLDKELVLFYLTNQFKPNRTELNRLVSKIIDNPKNKFLITKKIINEIESNLDNDPVVVDYFQSWVKVIIDSAMLELSNYEESNTRDITQEIEYGINCYKGNFISGIFLNTKSINLQIPCSVITQILKPNLSWIIGELAANANGFAVRYFDFQSNKQIQDFFDDIFSLPLKIANVYFFDRQCNLNHNCFDRLITRKPRVKYYTANCKAPLENQTNKLSVTRKFGNQTEVFLSRRDNIHERRIIIDSLIVESDDDFYNILVNRSTWTINVICCETTSSKHLMKTSLFQKAL